MNYFIGFLLSIKSFSLYYLEGITMEQPCKMCMPISQQNDLGSVGRVTNIIKGQAHSDTIVEN